MITLGRCRMSEVQVAQSSEARAIESPSEYGTVSLPVNVRRKLVRIAKFYFGFGTFTEFV